MSQNPPKQPLWDFLSFCHPNHLVLAGANNRNVIYLLIPHGPCSSKSRFFLASWLYISTVSIYAQVTMSASLGFRLLGKIPAGAISKIIMIKENHTLWLLRIALNNNNYYLLKIFPLFWLAKSTHIIHHNQLLMTKFGRILCLTMKWCQNCSPLHRLRHCCREDLGTKLSCFSCENKNGGHFTRFKSSRVRTTARTRRNNS